MSLLGKLAPAVALLLGACATVNDTTPIDKAGQRPELKSTEAGLWMQMDRFETRLATSALIDRDPELNAYVERLICKVTPKYCGDIRLFVIKYPYFNASMAPNGAMHVWSGLLLRVQNESQLATVLGHEIAHYLNRDGLKQWNNAKATTDFLAFFSIATGGIGGGLIGLAATVGGAGSLAAYSRELETNADKDGLTMLSEAGLDTREAAKIWRQVKLEKEAAETNEAPNVFWASHPPTEDRIANLEKWSTAFEKTPAVTNHSDGEEFSRIRLERWQKWTEELISSASPAEALIVLAQLRENGMSSLEVSFFEGEVYRRRGDKGDFEKAMASYKEAASKEPAPLKTYKSMGLVAKRMDDTDAAVTYFQTYLTQNPDATDQALVRLYIQQLRE